MKKIRKKASSLRRDSEGWHVVQHERVVFRAGKKSCKRECSRLNMIAVNEHIRHQVGMSECQSWKVFNHGNLGKIGKLGTHRIKSTCTIPVSQLLAIAALGKG